MELKAELLKPVTFVLKLAAKDHTLEERIEAHFLVQTSEFCVAIYRVHPELQELELAAHRARVLGWDVIRPSRESK